MIDFLADHLAVIMFLVLTVITFVGYPIAFVLGAIGIVFGLILVQMEGGWTILKTDRPFLHMLRGVMVVVSNMTYFVAIAVLPLVNRSIQPEDAFFAEGLHDELLTQLSRISALKVISRTSVMGYAGTTKRISEIGEELGVATLLEGGVQRSGNRVRINVQLIDAASDEHLWAEIYDRELTADNLFDIQSDITRAIAAALQAVLTGEE